MEKRTVIAVLLSIAVLMIWQMVYVQPKMEEQRELMKIEQQRIEREQKEEEKKQKVQELIKAEVEKEEQKPAEEIKAKEEIILEKMTAAAPEKITVENKYFKVEITNSGGRVLSWKLKDYKNEKDKPLELVNTRMKNRGYLPLALISPSDPDLAATINASLFRSNITAGQKVVLKEGSGESRQVVLEYSDGKAIYLKKVLTFHSDSYLVDMEFYAKGRPIKNSFITVGPGLENVSKENGGSSAMFGMGGGGYQVVLGSRTGDAERVDEAEKRVLIPTSELKYAGVETLYFAALLTNLDSNGGDKNIIITKIDDNTFDKVEAAQAMIVGIEVDSSVTASLFVGPKSLSLSKELGLSKLIDFGFWSFLALPLLYLLNAVNGFTGNYGLAIIIMTIVINLVFYPLRQKSYKSMDKMRDVQPKINAIKSKYEKFKKDAQKRQEMNQEIMTLYRTEGVSPTGGCLPLLIQFPFLIAIYKMLAVAIEMRHAPFMLWITDLSIKDPYYITPLVMGFTMWYQNKLNPPATGGDQTTAKMMKYLPILFTFMFLNFPSGLVLYWLFNNILAIGQQYLIKKDKLKRKELAKQKRR